MGLGFDVGGRGGVAIGGAIGIGGATLAELSARFGRMEVGVAFSAGFPDLAWVSTLYSSHNEKGIKVSSF